MKVKKDDKKCKYFTQEDTTSWHSDIFDHPNYECYCTKNNQKKYLSIPERQCMRCVEKEKNNG